MLYGGNVDADQPVLWCTLICTFLALLQNREILYKCIDIEGPDLTVWINSRFGPSLFIYGIRSLFSLHVFFYFSVYRYLVFEIKRRIKLPLVPYFRPLRMIGIFCSITKTRLYNFDPGKPHFYIIKLGFTGVYIIFLVSAQKHRLWVMVRTASARWF